MWMNEYDIEDAYRDYGEQQTPLGEAVRSLYAVMRATNSNSDGWPYYGSRTGSGALCELVFPGGRNRRYSHDNLPEVTQAQLTEALKHVKAFRTRTGKNGRKHWDFALTDAERAAEAAKLRAAAEVSHEAAVTALAGKMGDYLREATVLGADGSAEEIARVLAEIATA